MIKNSGHRRAVCCFKCILHNCSADIDNKFRTASGCRVWSDAQGMNLDNCPAYISDEFRTSGKTMLSPLSVLSDAARVSKH
mmetsp:Transcript_158773/g.280500  ORF Transcript_158773/g.280500 Transcript_158773/m.280500 type:complete len:81 (-) Transcript_158773:844-1086(-)